MRLPLIFSYYIGKHFIVSFAITMSIVMSVVGMIEFVELIRRTSNKPDATFAIVIEMAFLKLPNVAEEILPYGILIGSIMTLTKTTRSQELIIARSSGISVWQFLTPLCLAAFAIGVIVIMVFNPVSSAMNARYKSLEERYIVGKTSNLTVSSSGLWLRQSNDSKEKDVIKFFDKDVGEYILYAGKITHDKEMALGDITVFYYDNEGIFVGRIDADSAYLRENFWLLDEANLTLLGKTPIMHKDYKLPTDLNISQIQDSFADPSTLSFWQLTSFINTLEAAGFSALRHKVHWHATFALPILLSGMVLIAALFSLRIHRRGGVSILIVSGVAAGFIINFLLNLFHAFGYSGGLPVMLASWSPPAMTVILGTALLLHLEDG